MAKNSAALFQFTSVAPWRTGGARDGVVGPRRVLVALERDRPVRTKMTAKA